MDEISKPLEDCENTNIEEFLITCSDSITHSLDKHAPIRMFKRKVRTRRLWHNKDLQTQMCIVRNRERLWRKYLQDHLWLAFKIERNRYNKRLKESKEAFISADIVSYKKDIKYLYNVVTNLLGVRKENLMPSAESDQLLAEEFADVFIEKSIRYRKF